MSVGMLGWTVCQGTDFVQHIGFHTLLIWQAQTQFTPVIPNQGMYHRYLWKDKKETVE